MAALHNDATIKRLELMAAALEEVIRLHREVMASMKQEGPGTDGPDREESWSGPADGQRPGAS